VIPKAFIILLWALLACGYAHLASASKPDLALAVAKVAANEGALWNFYDTSLIWQVVEGHGETDAQRLKWLQKHSGRVLGMKTCTSGNCRWTKQLSKKATSMPAAIASGKGGPKDWEAYWRVVMAPRWGFVLRLAEELVGGRPYGHPCHITPVTWGSMRKNMPDERVALRNGLFPIGCEGTLNDGFAPIRDWPAGKLMGEVEW